MKEHGSRFAAILDVAWSAAVCVAALSIASPALAAGPASAANSTVPVGIALVAGNGVAVDPSGAATITVRDVGNFPMANVTVTFSIGACLDLVLSAVQPDPGLTFSCTAGTASKVTDALGQVTFDLAGHVQDHSLLVGAGCGTLTVGSVVIGHPTVTAMDQDGVNGVDTMGDLALWEQDFGSAQYHGRSDFDLSGSVGASDVSLLLARYGSGQVSTTFPRCDGLPTVHPVGLSGPGGISLTVDNVPAGDCGFGSHFATFSCTVNSGVHRVVAGLSGSVHMTGIGALEAIVEVRSATGTPLPSWWSMGVGGCRSSGMALKDASSTCVYLTGVAGSALLIQPANGGSVATYRVELSLGPNPPDIAIGGPDEPTDLGLFALEIPHTGTVGSPCTGCADAVEMTLVSVRFNRLCTGCTDEFRSQPAAPDANVVHWQSPLFALSTVSPALGPNFVTRRLHVEGANIAAGSTLRLVRAGQTSIVGSSTTVDPNGFWIEADCDLNGAATGTWTIEVTNPSSVARDLVDAFLIQPPIPGTLSPKLGAPALVRWNRLAQCSFGSSHNGNVPWSGLAFAVLYNDGGTGTISLDHDGTSLGSVTPAAGTRSLVGTYSVLIPAISSQVGTLNAQFSASSPFNCGNLEVDLFQVSKEGDAEAPAKAVSAAIHDGAIAQSISWPALGTPFSAAYATQLQTELDSRILALQTSPVANVALFDHAELLRQSVDAALSALAGAYPSDVSSYQAAWTALKTGSAWNAFRAGLPQIYAALSVPPAPTVGFPAAPLIRTVCWSGSFDPNAKVGPAGAGTSNAIAAATPMGYSIHFENLSTAPAAAQDVYVTDSLDTNVLKTSAFSFTEFTFGDHVVTPPPGRSNYTADVDLRPALDIIARITGVLDPGNGVVSVAYRSLDPNTMLPTEDPTLGFLPPNVTPPEGEGSVSFTLEQKPGLADGTILANHARVVFDNNAPIDTPVYSNALDLVAPASAVGSLSGSQGSASFPVSWAGTDAGAGVLDYSVYVRTDGGPYALWKHNTSATSATFDGLDGHQYGFYSVARDRIGLVEAAPAVPDATTQVTLGVDGAQAPLALAIRQVTNPVTSGMNVEFSLPGVAPGALQLFDVSGRCIRSISLSALPAGVHVRDLLGGNAVAAGVYFIRLRHGSGEARQRVIVLE